ncbi:MAG TPA: asparagine synthase (glutamine-hydrolyzing) [Gemmatimonadales bacterium]|nr:asparagine synthase (glutamine-hydrolyzing) [Gemmatimonadales bacterium]
MCGFVGILDRSSVAGDEVGRMADAIAHRGPDDATIHVEPGFGLGFRRLSIIDLAGGRQPIPNEDDTVWVVLNGEIYNYQTLRRQLLARGHRFRTQSDTEVLVHLYEDRGADLVRELRGMFAFALWDRRRRRLLIARDHLGQKPLYWARQGERLYFASEIKAILAVAPALRTLDPIALDEYLTLRVIADDRSMFRGIRKLPPAHLLDASDGRVSVERYWDLKFEPKQPLTEAEALDRLDHELREAVRLHMVSDVPVGAFLSGGVDSGLVVAAMRAATDEPFHTFSVSLPYGRFDEGPAARLVSARYGTTHHASVIDGDIVGLLPRVVYHLDEPSDPLSVCLYQLSATARREVKVALGGDGGDELFGGYDRYYGTLYVRHYAALPAALRRHVVRRILALAPDGAWYKSLTHQVRWMDELAQVDEGRRYARSLSYAYFTPPRRAELYSDDFRRSVAAFDAEASVIRWHGDARVKDAVDRMLLADSMVRLPNHSVMILDRMSMAHGLEARSPFLDHRLAEFAATLPVNLKIRGRRRRYLQMRLAERYIPPEVLRRPKQGFSSALPYLMRAQFGSIFGHWLRDARLVQAGLLRAPAIEAMLGSHLAGRADHGNRLWLLLNAELWYRIHIEGQSVAAVESELAETLGGRSQPPRAALARTA